MIHLPRRTSALSVLYRLTDREALDNVNHVRQSADMRRELGIKAGEVWAYREGKNAPLTRARVIDPGTHYDAYITVQLIDHPNLEHRVVKRVKLPCKWERLDDYLESTRLDREAEESLRQKIADAAENAPFNEKFGVSLPEILALQVWKIDRSGVPPIAYDMKSAARAVGLSVTSIRHAVTAGELKPRYSGSKRLIGHVELLEWFNHLPLDRPTH